ncbi:hypothetical protein [Parasphingorhabdus sp.]
MDLATDQVLISQITEEGFRQASFLDQRIVTPQLPRQLVQWDELSALDCPAQSQPQYIFHIGHVGSTLISRLLGEIDAIFALREPQLLRNLSELAQAFARENSSWTVETYEARLSEVVCWLSRSFHAHQRVMIKTSSFVSEIADRLLQNGASALFLYVPLHRYLPTILAGENSIKETGALLESRLQRLERRIGSMPGEARDLTVAQQVAASWLCEIVTLFEAKNTSATNDIKWLNFDDFLAAPKEQLLAIAGHFGHDLEDGQAASLVAGPIMSSYSKAPEHDYSPNLREELLVEASQIHAAEIENAMLWINELADRFPLIASAMQWIETER